MINYIMNEKCCRTGGLRSAGRQAKRDRVAGSGVACCLAPLPGSARPPQRGG